MIEFVMVAAGGMAGALLRFQVQRITPIMTVPLATIIVNLIGSFLLGLMIGAGIHGNLYLFGAVGFMGAFTTFSTLNVDLVKLILNKRAKPILFYTLATYIGGLLSGVAGLWIGRVI
ncbi:fluoride efflux transporter FluC [Mesobacillus subterraneus]|uniref:Fluoride-specific ion channel FluC n=1 Tax=Mesobacillus subterraneus TaxID=285983 RepID=A0A427TP77_9BACI|nr:CrcB family protein [Mesobacillus subterraneus]RSD26180.1 CrcB family protein [Mesobacillus subterraneus]